MQFSLTQSRQLPWPNNQRLAGLARVVGMMAWAAESGKPMDVAVMSLAPGRNPLSFVGGILAFLRSPMPWSGFYSCWTRSGFEWAAHRTSRALHDGATPADALRVGFGKLVPGYVYEALTIGNDADCLPEVLRLLERQLRGRIELDFQWYRAADLILIYLTPLVVIISGLAIFILPKFGKIASEMGVDINELPVHGMLMEWGGWPVPAILLLSFFCRGAATRLNEVLYYIPIVSGSLKAQARQQAADAVSVGLALKMDIDAALEFAEANSRRGWKHRSLARVRKLVRTGMSWDEAWITADLGVRLDGVLLRGAALAEDPTRGFRQISELWRERLCRRAVVMSRSIVVFVTLLGAVITGLVTYDIFQILIIMIEVTGTL